MVDVFLRHGYAVESSPTYDMIDRSQKQILEVSFDLYDDDNGPGPEPPPQDHLRLVSAVMPSHRRSPAAVGKPSFACFSAAIVTGRLCRPNKPTTFRPRLRIDAETSGGSEGHVHRRRKPRVEDGFLRYHLDVETNFCREGGIHVHTCPVRKRKEALTDYTYGEPLARRRGKSTKPFCA